MTQKDKGVEKQCGWFIVLLPAERPIVLLEIKQKGHYHLLEHVSKTLLAPNDIHKVRL